MLTKKNLQAGDRLILTKPLGTGIINTVNQGRHGLGGADRKITRLMAPLNRTAADIMTHFDVHACTDVTGFGLIGHLAEMIVESGKSVQLRAEQVPIIVEALEFAAMGLIPAGAHRNREFRESMSVWGEKVPRTMQDILVDPQTSGGLLIGVSQSQAADLVAALKDGGIDAAAVIGKVVEETEEKIRIG